MNDILQERIEDFLATHSKSDAGGWAPVGPDDIEKLGQIIQQLIELKYEDDADGDHPVEFDLVDRTKFERNHWLPIPYQNDEKSHLAAVDLAVTNSRIATDKLSTAWQLLKYRCSASDGYPKPNALVGRGA